MGCDIHLYVEYKNSEYENWNNFGKQFFITRDYGLFFVLAGVRSNLAPITFFYPRGIPKDISYETLEDYTIQVVTEEKKLGDYAYGYCTRETAEKYEKDSQKYDKHTLWWNENENRIIHPDWHTPSWLTIEELETAYNRYLSYYKEEDLTELEDIIKIKEDEKRANRLEIWRKSPQKLIPVKRISEIDAILAATKIFKEARVVFWFDN